MTISVLDETSDLARCASCGHLLGCPCPEDCAPSLMLLVLSEGRADRIVAEDDLPTLLGSGERIRLQLCQPGAAPQPLTLCQDYPQPGTWTVCVPGEAGVSEPVVVAEIKGGSEGEAAALSDVEPEAAGTCRHCGQHVTCYLGMWTDGDGCISCPAVLTLPDDHEPEVAAEARSGSEGER